MQLANKPYLIQLDGLRFVAVALVLVDHWLAERNTIPYGPLGVTLFFVLSGFLITRILLQSRAKHEGKPGGLRAYLTKFYIRRTLRIFPVYYASIFVLYLLNVPPVRDTLAWCLLYATNIYIALNQHWMGVIDHFWSLAVEEQYYIIFPLFLFFVPHRYLLTSFFGMIGLSIALRLYFHLAGYEWMVGYVTMPACLDSFGLGSLLAWLLLRHEQLFKKIFSNSSFILLGLISWVAVVYWSKTYDEIHNVANNVWERFFGSVFCFFLIGKAIVGFEGGIKWFLENKISNYLGKISYGLYVYHNFVFNFYHSSSSHPTVRLINRIQRELPGFDYMVVIELIVYFLLTVALASLSWYVLEQPINSLKDKFAH